MLNKFDEKRLKLRTKLDRPLEAMLHNRAWRKCWKFSQNHNINYYLHMAIAKFSEYKKNFRLKNFNLYAIGQSHLDACWLWTKLSTIRRAIITFQQAIDHFEQYPYFTFSQTTPQYYDWVKMLRPKLFKKIQEYEKKNRWEIIGGMWVEPDTNLPSGESLVRQRLYGQLFYLEHFGKLSRIESLSDTFGFNAQLPQILKKSGGEAFWTTKITWNDYNEFPFANFLWRGLDGSEIFTHMFLFNWNSVLSLDLYKRTSRKVNERGLVFDSSNTMEEFENALTEKRIKTCGIFYGFGDGGMGPWIEEIDIMTNIARAGHMKFCTVGQYFKTLRKECGDLLPVWNDELYLEFHRGIYTSQAETKRLNRLCEVKMRNCELILTFLSVIFREYFYPYEKIKKLWKHVLFNQFHDILPGSSIQDVYYEQEEELQNVVDDATAYISEALQLLLQTYLNLNEIKEQEQNDYLIVVNTIPWKRNGLIHIKDDNNRSVPIQLREIEPLSFQILKKSELLKKHEQSRKESVLKLWNVSDKFIFENKLISFTVEKESGKIVSLIHKENKREYIRERDGIGVHVYEERKIAHPAWSIYSGYTQLPVDIGMVKGIKVVEDSKSLKKIKIIYTFRNTKIEHYVSLRPDSLQIDLQTDIDVHDKYLLFKTRFPFNLNTNELAGEIPYGYLKRKIIPNTKMEEGKWEFPAQKYVDVSEEDRGITIVNNSKYGFSANEKGIYLTLVHTPARASSPFFSHLDLVPKQERTKYVDIGLNRTSYAIKIHKGGFKEAAAWRNGYEYNYPLLTAARNDQNLQNKIQLSDPYVHKRFKRIFKEPCSLVHVTNPNIILQTIKPPERIMINHLGDDGIKMKESTTFLILRLFETAGETQENVELQCHDALEIKNVVETDLLERDLQNQQKQTYKLQGKHKITLSFNKFEIKTLKILIQV
ncbi:MAG: glycoside hydrolase family 38 C-terminal domain-containing protein [Promethearchaeia archaeon]